MSSEFKTDPSSTQSGDVWGLRPKSDSGNKLRQEESLTSIVTIDVHTSHQPRTNHAHSSDLVDQKSEHHLKPVHGAKAPSKAAT